MAAQTHFRRWFLFTALAYLGRPYRWGGDDPSGIDCSGLVVECLMSVGLLRDGEDLSADGLRRRFAAIPSSAPAPGVLLFFLTTSGVAEHVVICLDQFVAIGASGGNSRVTTETDAWQANAFVKIRPIPPLGSSHLLLDPLAQLDRPVTPSP